MRHITRRSFLGLLKCVPLIPLLAKLPAPASEPIAEQSAQLVTEAPAEIDELGGFLVPPDAQENLRHIFITSDLAADNIVWTKALVRWQGELPVKP